LKQNLTLLKGETKDKDKGEIQVPYPESYYFFPALFYNSVEVGKQDVN